MTMSPAVPVPLMVGVVSLVVLSPTVPLSLVMSSMAVRLCGVAGALMLKASVLLVSAPSLLRLAAMSVNLSLATDKVALKTPAAGVKVAV